MAEVRRPLEAELHDIVRLRYVVLDEPKGLPFFDTLEDEDLADTTIHAAAFKGGAPVSTLRIEQHPEYGPYVRRMATTFDYLRQGLGRQVLQFAESIAVEQGIRELTLHSRTDSLPFYEKCGFVLTGEHNYDLYGTYPKMVKELT